MHMVIEMVENAGPWLHGLAPAVRSGCRSRTQGPPFLPFLYVDRFAPRDNEIRVHLLNVSCFLGITEDLNGASERLVKKSSAFPFPVADVLVPPAHDNLSPAPEHLAALLEPPHAEDHAAQVRRVVEYSPPGHDAARVQGDL